MKAENHQLLYRREAEAVADCRGMYLLIAFDSQLWLSAAVVSLGKKVYSHYFSHPPVNPGYGFVLTLQLHLQWPRWPFWDFPRLANGLLGCLAGEAYRKKVNFGEDKLWQILSLIAQSRAIKVLISTALTNQWLRLWWNCSELLSLQMFSSTKFFLYMLDV